MTIKDKIQKYCAYQERSPQEVHNKLIAFHCPEEELNVIFQSLIQDDFLNEKRYIASFIQGKINTKGWGKNKLRFELKRKGISEKQITHYFNQIPDITFKNSLKEHYTKWLKTNELNQKTYPKLMRYLMSKGYTLDEIRTTIKDIDY